ncbi:hypothetical protein EXS74_02890 [Candidatus Woesearchaeota archaeon]|nr:hypothetical protein [Candidatus Woesearchaeota archaeon]
MSALAVTPTIVTVTEDVGAKLYVYNTLNQTMVFQIEGIYAENFTLEGNTLKIVDIPAQKKRGILRIKELYPQGFVNAVEIPVEVQRKAKESSFDVTSLPFALLSGLSLTLLFVGMYGWKRKRKKNTTLI